MSRTVRSALGTMLGRIAVVAGALLCALPLVWMVLTSLKQPDAAKTALVVNPADLTLDNYRNVADRLPLLRLFLNSLGVSAAILTLQIAVGVPAAYALSQLRFRGHNGVQWLVLATLMIPVQTTVLPVYVLLSKLGLVNTYASLIVPFAASGFGIFLLTQFFRQIPRSLIDAARLDGFSDWKIAWTIVFPIARPAVVAFGIFSVVTHWNDFFWPLMMTVGLDRAPISAGIGYFVDAEGGRDWGGQMALATVAVLPLVIGFALAQRRFIEGLALTSIRA